MCVGRVGALLHPPVGPRAAQLGGAHVRGPAPPGGAPPPGVCPPPRRSRRRRRRTPWSPRSLPPLAPWRASKPLFSVLTASTCSLISRMTSQLALSVEGETPNTQSTLVTSYPVPKLPEVPSRTYSLLGTLRSMLSRKLKSIIKLNTFLKCVAALGS